MSFFSDVLGGIPGVGSIASGIAGIGNVIGQISANKANKQIARETNAQNYKIWQEQLQQTWDMWNANNEYNTAKAQRERLEQAGLNPYMMLNGGSAGIAEGANIPSPSPAVTGAPVRPVDYSGLGNVFNKYMELENFKRQNQKLDGEIEYQKAQTNAVKQDNMFNALSFLGRLRKINLDADTQQFVRDLTKRELEAYNDDYIWNRKLTRENAFNLAANTALVNEKVETEKWQQSAIQAGIKLNYQQLSNLRAEIKEIISRMALNYSGVDVNVKTARKIAAETTGILIDNGVKGINFNVLNSPQTRAWLTDQLYNETMLKRETLKKMRQDYSNPFKYILGSPTNLVPDALWTKWFLR